MERWAISLHDLTGDPATITIGTLGPAINQIIGWMIGFAGALAVIYLIWGGLQYLTAGADEGQVEKAKGTMTWALIGLLVVLGAYAIVAYVSGTLIKDSPL